MASIHYDVECARCKPLVPGLNVKLSRQYPACIIPYGNASKELDPDAMVVEDNVQPSCKFGDVDILFKADARLQITRPMLIALLVLSRSYLRDSKTRSVCGERVSWKRL